MARSSKPRKAYRQRSIAEPSGRTQPWLIEATFAPFENMLHHLQRDGGFEVTDEGVMVYPLHRDEVRYPVVEAFEACTEMFDIARSRDAACPDSAPLHRLIRALEAGEVGGEDVEAAVRCLTSLRAYASSQPIKVLADIAKTVEIKFRLQALDR